jgi:phosphoribosylanthranilate isomerase
MPLDIKICGLKTPEAVAAALAGGASHVGFIFFPKSPRNIAPAEAGRLRVMARRRAKAVAVTVDADDAALDAIVSAMSPDMLQLHGKEPPERVAEVKARYGLPVIKAFSVRVAGDLEPIALYRGVADRFLLDAKPPAGSELPGGNGVPFDWRLLAGLDADVNYMLSGGLNTQNIGEALRLTNPPGIDISSGVESAPGLKDAVLIESFFRAVKAAECNRTLCSQPPGNLKDSELKSGLRTLLSSASEHENLVCELYYDDAFLLLVSHERNGFKVEFSSSGPGVPIPLDDLIQGILACKSRLEPA